MQRWIPIFVPSLLFSCLFLAVYCFSESSFIHKKPLPTATRRLIHLPTAIPSNHRSGRRSPKFYSLLCMRDKSSSYWFTIGDTVKVIAEDVVKAGVNLQGRTGIVKETWEKCDVDPTCCCAEQVDENMAVRVEFKSVVDDPLVAQMSFTHYFAEEELQKVKEEQTATVETKLS